MKRAEFRMKKILLALASLVLMVAAAFTAAKATSTSAGAATPTYNIGIKGLPLEGATKGQAGEPTIFLFTVTNNSPTTYQPYDSTYFLSLFLSTGGTLTTFECVSSTGWVTYGDDSASKGLCQMPGLAPGASLQVPVDVTGGSNPIVNGHEQPLVVKLCTGPAAYSTAHCGSTSISLND
jgi:hypothetical protein